MAALELYLIRHGLAAERGDDWPDDTKRPLTKDGISRLHREAEALENLGIVFAQIVTSPLVRTRQTADVFAEFVKPKIPIAHLDALRPEGTAAAVIEELPRYTKKGSVALVGHEPNLGELAGKLIGSKTPLPFKKGGMCRIDFEVLPPKGLGQLRWFMSPRMLRRLA
jgi:phosphohistidine phosphatase